MCEYLIFFFNFIELETVSVCLALNHYKQAELHFEKAKQILKIDPGENHPFVINKLGEFEKLIDMKRNQISDTSPVNNAKRCKNFKKNTHRKR